MAITDPNTVLIIGAGASVPFGLPLGGKLIDLIADQLAMEILFLESQFSQKYSDHLMAAGYRNDKSIRPESLLLASVIAEIDITIWRPDPAVLESCLDKMTKLRDLLRNQTSETIDDFIAINPSVSDITKLAVATIFFHRLYEPNPKPPSKWVLHDLSVRHFGQTERRNWVHHLINLIRHNNFPRTETLKKVKIINFNYDGLVEDILEEQFDNTEENFGDWREYVEIVHPHGFMGIPEKETEDPVALIRSLADNICVVRERCVPPEVMQDRDTARHWIKFSREVYMVGFALSGPNADMLGLGSYENLPQKWFAANFDGSSGFRRNVMGYERKVIDEIPNQLGEHEPTKGHIDIEIEPGSRDDPLHIDTWFQINIPGQQPA